MPAEAKKITEPTNAISQVRYVCAIGASHTASAIPRVIPIAHCGPGCADKQFVNVSSYNGFQGGGYGGGAVVPSTNFSESEVVFGGCDRLRELIASSIKIMDADLFVVMTGCIPDMVGDDVESVVEDFRNDGIPIVAAETGGFRGNNYKGHEIVIRAIIDDFVGDYTGPREKGMVNVWSEIPYQDTFWRGDLDELKRILSGIGLKVNILFGHGSRGVCEWNDIPKAQFNLVVSPWLGLETARHLKGKYGQPYLHIPAIPIGAQETSAFLRKVADFAGIDRVRADAFIKSEEEYYYRYLEDFSDFYSEYWWGLPSSYSVVCDSAYNLSINRFLVNQLGLVPSLQIITENPPSEYRGAIINEFEHLADGVCAHVQFYEDSYIIHERLRNADFGHRPPLIFGSTWERDIARELKGKIIEVGFPASYEVVVNRSNIGYRGALSLLEKTFTTAIGTSA